MPRVRRYEDDRTTQPQSTSARFLAPHGPGGLGRPPGDALARQADALAIREEHRARELEVATAREFQQLQERVRAARGIAAEHAVAAARQRIEAMRRDLLTRAESTIMRNMLADVFNQRAEIAGHEMEAHAERETSASHLDISMQHQGLAQDDDNRAEPTGMSDPSRWRANEPILSAASAGEIGRGDALQLAARFDGASGAAALQSGPQDLVVTAPDGTQRLNEEIADIEQATGQPVAPDDYAKTSRTLDEMNQWLGAQGGSAPKGAGAPQAGGAPRTGARRTGGYVAPALGSLSKIYEAGPNGGPGTVSNPGKGDKGGVSYGIFQMTSQPKGGTVTEFLSNKYGSVWRNEFAGLVPGGAAFSKKWVEIAQRETARFEEAQTRFIGGTHYDDAVRDVRAATGLDLDTRSEAIRNAVWSAAVQHRAKAPPKVFIPAIQAADKATGGNRRDPRYDAILLDAAYASRTTFVASQEAYQRKLAAAADVKLAALARIGAQRLSPAQKKAQGVLQDARDTALKKARQFHNMQVSRFVNEPRDARRMLKEQTDAGDWPK